MGSYVVPRKGQLAGRSVAREGLRLRRRTAPVLRGRWRIRADENGAYRRGPPLPAPVGSRDLVGVEVGGDLMEALAGGAFGTDPFDDFGRYETWAASGCRGGAWFGSSSLFGEEAFELVDGDQLCAPGHFDRLDVGEDLADEGGAAEAECCAGLAAGVGEPLDARWLMNADPLCGRGRLGCPAGMGECSGAPAAGSAFGHGGHRTRIVAGFAPMVHLCLADHRS
jgi:hypothetical protein